MQKPMRLASDHAKALPTKVDFTIPRLTAMKCPTGKGRTWMYDGKVPGLCLMVTEGGSKSFYFYKKIGGRFVRERLGGFPELHLDDARKSVTQRMGDAARGVDLAERRRAQRAALTLVELFNHYLESHAKAHKKRWGDDVKQFERYFGKAPEDRKPDDKPVPFPGWRNRSVNTIDTEAVKSLHVKIGEKHGKYAANRVLALLSSMFSNAGLPSVTKSVQKFKEEQRERFLDAEELARFCKALDDEPDTMMADYFRVLLFTMARRANVAAMRWADVNFIRREWTVPGEKTKNGDPLIVSLSDEAMAVLLPRWSDRAENAEYVFPSYGTQGHLVEPKAAWARVLERAAIENFRIHDLRHTGASWMAIGGSSLPIIGKALGHKSQQSTARYAHVNRTAAAAALQSATSAMAAMMAGTGTAPAK